MGSNSSTIAQAGNPVLSTFGGFAIQPYWLIIVQLITIQLMQRLYSKFVCWVKEEKQSCIDVIIPLHRVFTARRHDTL